ncbi:hypothetical protein D3C85_1134610 [compost metagenome]
MYKQPFTSTIPAHAAQSIFKCAKTLWLVIRPSACKWLCRAAEFLSIAAAAKLAVLFWLPPISTLPKAPIILPLKQLKGLGTTDAGMQISMRLSLLTLK